jgi:1-acyl-sn-glycerol-3-phosphate acyltransferase
LTPVHERAYDLSQTEVRPVIYALRYLLVALYTIFWASLACVAPVVDRSGESPVWMARCWIRWIFATCGIRVVAEGLENIDPNQSYVFMTNHQSVIDIGAIIATIPVSFRFVAKKELTWIPFFGWALRPAGHVIIDRGNRSKAVRSLERAAQRVANGVNVIIFPEGTRSPTGELRAFKSGGFHLAIGAQVPILPATISGSQAITPKRSLRIESGTVKIVYGKPIPTAGLSVDDRERLKDRVREAILQGYDPAYQRNAPECPGSAAGERRSSAA